MFTFAACPPPCTYHMQFCRGSCSPANWIWRVKTGKGENSGENWNADANLRGPQSVDLLLDARHWVCTIAFEWTHQIGHPPLQDLAQLLLLKLAKARVSKVWRMKTLNQVLERPHPAAWSAEGRARKSLQFWIQGCSHEQSEKERAAPTFFPQRMALTCRSHVHTLSECCLFGWPTLEISLVQRESVWVNIPQACGKWVGITDEVNTWKNLLSYPEVRSRSSLST